MKKEKYQHSSYFNAKKSLENECCMSRKEFAKIPCSDKLPFGVVELAHTAACFKLMNSYDMDVVNLGLHGLIPALITDFAIAMKRDVKRIRNIVLRNKYKAELQKQIAILRRAEREDKEKERRRILAEKRRKVVSRTTLAPMPDPDQLIEAWNNRKKSHEAMILLGGMIHDLECYVDNRLKINEYGRIIGRNRGIRGWLKECAPELSLHYKSLMRYKAMAKKLRQVTKTEDPIPTSYLLNEECASDNAKNNEENVIDNTKNANDENLPPKKVPAGNTGVHDIHSGSEIKRMNETSQIDENKQINGIKSGRIIKCRVNSRHRIFREIKKLEKTTFSSLEELIDDFLGMDA